MSKSHCAALVILLIFVPFHNKGIIGYHHDKKCYLFSAKNVQILSILVPFLSIWVHSCGQCDPCFVHSHE